LKCLPVFAAIVLVTGLSAPALGQPTYGTILGTVTDAAGSVIPNAEVQASDQRTDVTRPAHTDDAGNYRFVNMDPGSYAITVAAPSFATAKNESVVLPARETVRTDFRLCEVQHLQRAWDRICNRKRKQKKEKRN
jgi:hypothetical protein